MSDRTSDLRLYQATRRESVKVPVPLARAYSNPYVQEQIAHLHALMPEDIRQGRQAIPLTGGEEQSILRLERNTPRRTIRASGAGG